MRRAPLLSALVALPLLVVLHSTADAAEGEPAPLPSSTDVDYQLGGAADVPEQVGIVVRDRTEAPTGDRYDVCYVNGFQTQPDQKHFWRQRWALVLKDARGRAVVDSAWGEWLLDVSTARKRERLAGIVGGWTDGCAQDGFDAVEYDNLDSYSRSHGLLRARDATAYAALLVTRAHEAGLAAGQKNRAGWDGTKVGYDFAVSEECGHYDECDAYTEVYGDQVLMLEYHQADFEETCAAYGAEVPVVLRDRDLSPDGVHEYC